MQQLNLPAFDYKLKREEGKVWIFDTVRKKFLILTPEEWVRQHFLHYIIETLKYPRSMIKVEGGLTYNQLNRRSDIVVFDRQAKPWMLIECKAADQKISDATLRQASAYNATLRANYLTVTNGMSHFCSRINWVEHTTEMLRELPLYGDAVEDA
jgi:hypothetical protein